MCSSVPCAFCAAPLPNQLEDPGWEKTGLGGFVPFLAYGVTGQAAHFCLVSIGGCALSPQEHGCPFPRGVISCCELVRLLMIPTYRCMSIYPTPSARFTHPTTSSLARHRALLGYEDLLGIHGKTIPRFAGAQVPPPSSFWEPLHSTFGTTIQGERGWFCAP